MYLVYYLDNQMILFHIERESQKSYVSKHGDKNGIVMLLKEWIDNKGLDTVNEELLELLAPCSRGQLTIANEIDEYGDPDYGEIEILFSIHLDGEEVADPWVNCDFEVDENYDSKAFLADLDNSYYNSILENIAMVPPEYVKFAEQMHLIASKYYHDNML